MYYLVTLKAHLLNVLKNSSDYEYVQSYTEVWTINEYYVKEHSIPIVDKVRVSSSGNSPQSSWTEEISVVVESPSYSDLKSKLEIFKRGKSLILDNPRMLKKLYFEEIN